MPSHEPDCIWIRALAAAATFAAVALIHYFADGSPSPVVFGVSFEPVINAGSEFVLEIREMHG